MQAWNLQTYGAGKDRWNEYYSRKKREEFKSDLILIYFAITILAYVAVIIFGV